MGALQKLQNSIQILIILWPVYPIHTNSLFWVIFEELPLFCHFPPPITSIRGKDSQISFEHIRFSNKRKITFLNGLLYLFEDLFRWMPVAGHGKFSDEFLLHRRRKNGKFD